jgi:16S rRNA (cytidine1402-2'-O)-methyltransferase
MEDMTLRAIRVLKEADLILAEDTRTSSILLKHYDIQNHLISHHKFNEHGTSAGIVERLKAGQTVALISDAGTPGISDPGFFLSPRGSQGRCHSAVSAWCYGLHSCNCRFRSSL